MSIFTNLFDLVVSKDQANVPYISFTDEQQLDALKKDNPQAIFMPSKDKILFWGTDSLSNNGYLRIAKNEDVYLLLNVLAHSLLEQFFKSTDIKISKKNYIYKISLFAQDISKNRYQGIRLHRAFHIHFTPYHANSSLRLGFTVSSSIVGNITLSKQDFESYKIPSDDLLHNKETGEIFATTDAIYRLANHYNYSSQIKREFDTQNSIQREYEEINGFIESYFRNSFSKFLLPDELRVNAINEIVYHENSQQADYKVNVIPKPESYFYNGNYPKKENSFPQRRKINFNKPFTYDAFENKSINITVIFPKSCYQDVRSFFASVQSELLETFKMKKDNLKFSTIQIDSFALKDYQKVLSSIKNTDLVIVVVEQAHKALIPRESPYYFCKAEFIKRGINTQEVQIQQMQQFLMDKKSQVSNYTDHNIALNIYAKLGGMAWTIKPYQQKNELVIGIGATTNKDGQPILGLTSIFRGDGKYLLGKTSSVTNMVDYREKLEEVISTTIENSITDGILNTDKPIYLIFHIFKPAGKDNEIEALDRVIKRFSKYSFKYAFVHIGENHNYRFFTYEENAPPSLTSRNVLSQNKRGTLIKVTPTRGFLGLRSKSSTFFKIDIHRKSNFVDLEYIAEQIYQFAEMSHTSYNKQGTPITIKYPRLMAGFVEKFKEGDLIYLEEVTMPDHSLWFI
ncbi:MAG: hypothetical protein HUU45_13245 [Leptospiraceae bacterium]|nr:hypothetical protein [Leptospiraceae bacterium]